MIPNRTQIQTKITEILQNNPSAVLITEVGAWLDSISCPEKDKVAILEDLLSYVVNSL